MSSDFDEMDDGGSASIGANSSREIDNTSNADLSIQDSGTSDIQSEPTSEQIERLELEVRELRVDVNEMPSEEDLARLNARMRGLRRQLSDISGVIENFVQQQQQYEGKTSDQPRHSANGPSESQDMNQTASTADSEVKYSFKSFLLWGAVAEGAILGMIGLFYIQNILPIVVAAPLGVVMVLMIVSSLKTWYEFQSA